MRIVSLGVILKHVKNFSKIKDLIEIYADA